MADAEFKYLAVHGWAKYQERIGKDGVRRPFIKTATYLDSDPDFSSLRMFSREVLEGLRRATAAHAQNPYNDSMWVARALCVLPTDRPHIAHALRTLIARGFLTPTNQKDPFAETPNDTIRNETKRTKAGHFSSSEKRVGQEQEQPPADLDFDFGDTQ